MGLMSYAGKMALGGGSKALKGAMMGPGIAEMKAGLGLGMGVGGGLLARARQRKREDV